MRSTITSLFLILTSFLCSKAQTYTLEEKWVDCGNNIQLLDPYYTPGVLLLGQAHLGMGKPMVKA